MTEFKREDRYLVLKRKDLATLPKHAQYLLNCWLEDNAKDIPERKYVVVESDWPEYETVFKMIEARVTGKPATGWTLRKFDDLADVINDSGEVIATLYGAEAERIVAAHNAITTEGGDHG